MGTVNIYVVIEGCYTKGNVFSECVWPDNAGHSTMNIAEQLDDEVRLNSIKDILNGDLIDAGFQQIILSDLSGNIIAQYDNGEIVYDSTSLAVLAASNIGSLNAMSQFLGEGDFPLFILKGKSDNIHFNKVTNELFLISIFSQELSIGFVRNKVDNAISGLRLLIDHCAATPVSE